MKDVKSHKLILGCIAVLVLSLIATSPVTTIWLIRRQAAEIVSGSLQGLASSSMASVNVSEGFLQIAQAVSTGPDSKVPELSTQLEDSSRKVDAQYEAYKATIDSAEESGAFNRMLQLRQTYRESRKAVLQLLEQGRQDQARAVFQQDCVAKFRAYSDSLSAIIQSSVRDATLRGARIVQSCQMLLVLQVVLVGFFIVYGFFVPLVTLLEKLTRRPASEPAGKAVLGLGRLYLFAALSRCPK